MTRSERDDAALTSDGRPDWRAGPKRPAAMRRKDNPSKLRTGGIPTDHSIVSPNSGAANCKQPPLLGEGPG